MQIRNHSPEELKLMIRDFTFPGYLELEECRKTVDDCLAGQRTIKAKQEYLPPNKWQQTHEDEYRAFLRRAFFPGDTRYALDVYEGLFCHGNPHVVLPPDGSLNYLISDASVDGDGLKQIQVRTNSGQMSHGLSCLLLETRESPERPFFIQEYVASKFLRAHFTQIDGESVADFILLDESTFEYDLVHFRDTPVYRLRLLALDANGLYYQRSIDPVELKEGFDVKNPPRDSRTIYPKIQGKTFNRIPFVWCGAFSLSGKTFDYPPLLNMAQMELKLYMAMAYHSQHIYMNTQEFLVFTGVGKGFNMNDITVGAGGGVAFDKPDAKAYYCSTNGVGFTAEKEEIEMLQAGIEEKRLSLMSAKSHQSGSVVGLIQSSQTAPLRQIVSISGDAITKILRYMVQWLGYEQKDVESVQYIPSQQFANASVNLSEFISLSKAVMDGDVKMLESDLYRLAKESGYVKDSVTWEDFKQKYEIESEDRRSKQAIVVKSSGNPFARTNGFNNAAKENNGMENEDI